MMRNLVNVVAMLIAVFCVSCSKDEEPKDKEPAIGIEMKDPELDFFGIANKSLTNILVGDMVKVTWEVTKINGATSMIVKPVSKAAAFHELLNTDFKMFVAVGTEEGMYTEVTTILLKEGVNTFYVKPIVSGTFQINFEAVSSDFEVSKKIVFTAVKFTTLIQGSLDGNCGLSRWRNHHYSFSIDAGSQAYDLAFKELNATYSYKTEYRNDSYSGTFGQNSSLKLINSVGECGNYPSVDRNINKIEISKTLDGKTEIVATYYNIPIGD